MLKSLSIQNYALIQNLNIGFHDGMSVITGETGAGKSIMLGALNMILGQRADQSAILDKNRKCIIEARFLVSAYGLEHWFVQNDLDYEPETLIRREIALSGKSRAFINDTPVTLELLKNLTELLIDIHSQHENLLINDSGFQMKIVDGIAGNASFVKDYQASYAFWFKQKKELQTVKTEAVKAAADKDYFQFQYDQLEEAKLDDGDEQLKLEAELGALTHAEDIKTALLQVSDSLDNEHKGALGLLQEAHTAADKSAAFLPLSESLAQRLKSVIIELKDIAGEAALKANDIEYLPGRIDEINERLNLLNGLQFKHRMEDVMSLIELKEELEKKLQNISGFDDAIADLEKQVASAYVAMKSAAEKLTESRCKVFPLLEKKVSGLLHLLGMPNGVFSLAHELSDDFSSEGRDRMAFLFSSNKKHQPQHLFKVASGGEKSRLMLALKSLLSESKALPTIVFDEIDAGISGGIATKMGKIMQQMGQGMQVITITHLPQIAACGTHHYKVYKTDGEMPTSNVLELKQDERLHEIATLLSSESVTQNALNNAREMMGN